VNRDLCACTPAGMNVTDRLLTHTAHGWCTAPREWCYTLNNVIGMVEREGGMTVSEVAHPGRPQALYCTPPYPKVLLLYGNTTSVMSFRGGGPEWPAFGQAGSIWSAPHMHSAHCDIVLSVLRQLWDEGYHWAQLEHIHLPCVSIIQRGPRAPACDSIALPHGYIPLTYVPLINMQ